MNKRTVERVLREKHEDFLKSIGTKEVRDLVEKNSIITGGSIVSLLMGEKVSDFDYYFTDLDTVKAVAHYYVDLFNTARVKKSNKTDRPEVKIENGRVRIRIQSAGMVGEDTDEARYEYFEGRPDEEGDAYITDSMTRVVEEADKIDSDLLETETKAKYRPIFLTDNAITLSGRVQLVMRFYGEPSEIHKNFDFVHCTNYWTSKDKKLVLQPDAMESILGKELRYFGSLYPVCSVIRMRKFLRKGWWINAGQILKMLLQVSELNLTDTKVLEDQLTGVDTFYFFDLIKRLKEMQSKDKPVDTAYITTLIDRMF